MRDPERDRQTELLLEECWEPVTQVLLARGADIFSEVIAAAARSDDDSQVRCARTLALQSKSLAHAFRSAARIEFDDALASFLGKDEVVVFRASALSLVEIDESDLSSQVDQAAAHLRNLVQLSYGSLVARIQALVPEDEVGESDIPLRPAIFLQAVAQTLLPVVGSASDLAALLRYCPVAFAPHLATTYETLNRHLESKGIVPAFSRGGTPVRPSVAAPAQSAAGPAPAAAPGARGAAAAGAVPSSPTSAAEPSEKGMQEYGRLQALVGVNASSLVDRAVQAGRGGPVEASPIDPKLAEALVGAQKQDAAFLVAQERQRDPEAPVPGAPPATRELGRSLIRLATSTQQKLTIQLVARIFARMERDRLIPGPVRAMLAALRCPAIEVALADPTIFVAASHPVRNLLNTVGSAAIGWTGDGSSNRRFLRHVRAAVQFVLHSPGHAAAAFVQASTQFSTFVRADAANKDPSLAQALEILREAEEREVCKLAVAAFLRDLIEGAQIEGYLRIFLLDVWSRVLVEVAMSDAQAPGMERRMLGVVSGIVSSVQALMGPSDRKRMIEAIPGVLNGLREGVTLIGWPEDQFSAFLERLMRAHSEILKAPDAPPGTPVFPMSTLRIRLDGYRIDTTLRTTHEKNIEVLEEAVEHFLQVRQSDITHEWRLSKSAGAPAPAEASHAEHAILQWHTGTWFDLRIGRSSARVRFEGFTPARSLALFTGMEGGQRYSLSRASLRNYVHRSWIVPAETRPVVARAFAATLADLTRAYEAENQGPSGS